MTDDVPATAGSFPLRATVDKPDETAVGILAVDVVCRAPIRVESQKAEARTRVKRVARSVAQKYPGR